MHVHARYPTFRALMRTRSDTCEHCRPCGAWEALQTPTDIREPLRTLPDFSKLTHLAAEHLVGALGPELGPALLEAVKAGAPSVADVLAERSELGLAQHLQRRVQADVLRALHL
eukprot:1950185-Pyramimonas_sp.AAC.1